MNSHKTFKTPDVVKPVNFNGFTYKDGILSVNMPSKSVIVIEMSK
jgi:hypothetical protein